MAKRRDYRSAESAQYRPLYATARWKRIREHQRKIEPLCRMCLAVGRVTPMAVCDHIDPKSKKDPEGFFAGPFQSLCQPHHDSTKAREEARGYVIGCDVAGRPLDPEHPWNKASA